MDLDRFCKRITIASLYLRYAQVIKEREGGKLVKVHKKIIFGDKEDISQSDISTSHIERQNLTFRQENERLARKTIGFSKEDYWLERQMIFYMAFFDFMKTRDLYLFMGTHFRYGTWIIIGLFYPQKRKGIQVKLGDV